MLTEEEYNKLHPHSDAMCDSCLEKIGRQNLIKVPFLYLDLNDKSHKDLGHGYRQYWVCEKCYKRKCKTS